MYYYKFFKGVVFPGIDLSKMAEDLIMYVVLSIYYFEFLDFWTRFSVEPIISGKNQKSKKRQN